MSRIALTLALVAPLALLARDADACGCGGDMFVQPSDGATAVPLNAGIFLVKTDAHRVALYRQADDHPIALTLEDDASPPSLYHNVFARPTEALDPGTTYEIRIPTDDEDPSELVATFTTGTVTDDIAPTFAGVTAVRPHLWRTTAPGSSCWTREHGDDDIVLEHELPSADVAGFILEIRREYEPQATFRTRVATSIYPDVPPMPYSHLRGDYCSYTSVPVLTAATTYCGRVIAFDRAGNQSGETVEVCAPAVTCSLQTENFVSPVDVCAPTTFPPPGSDAADGSGGGCTLAPPRSARGTLATLTIVASVLVLRRRRRG